MKHKILLWDNDGTVMGTKDPNDKNSKIILPGVKELMAEADYNFIISGFKSPESEIQNFDPEKIIERFINLMEQLPINAAAFSPNIGGVACYVVIKNLNGEIIIKKAHDEPRYQEYIGKFKKPDIGMFKVIKDLAKEEYNLLIDKDNSIMIGDTWHDQKAAESFGIKFLDASFVHNMQAGKK